MTKILEGHASDIRQDLTEAGAVYGISVGRRAPMHRMHTDCLREIAQAGLLPVVLIGSTNGADSPLFDPLRNPLTVAQQKEQLKIAVPELYDDSRILTLEDRGQEDLWLADLSAVAADAGIAGKALVHLRTKPADAGKQGAQIRPIGDYAAGLVRHGFGVWISVNRDPADDAVNASDIRAYDLGNLTEAQRSVIAAPDYLVSIARKARRENPDADLLEQHNIPLTMLDLSLDRLRVEAGIATGDIVATAKKQGSVTPASLAAAASLIVQETRMSRPHFSSKATSAESFPVKIASASCNQTAGDWPRNVANICKAIDMAVADGADILALEELGLTGYERGDDFYYSDNEKTHEMLQLIADYAASKNPELVISVGHPWYFSDKDLPDQEERRKNPLFNRINNNFNVQTLIAGGEIQAMSAKRYLFNYERGYEKRHFEEWSDRLADQYENRFGKGREGTIMIELPAREDADGTPRPARVIPFGSPVVQIGGGGKKINVNHVICEEYWVGSRFDGATDAREYDRDNPLAQKARLFDISLAINPNASPPVADKIDKHHELCKLATRHCQAIVHTDGLGSSGSTFAQFGSRLMAQEGKIISEGQRLSLHDVSYTSQIVKLKPATDKGRKPHAVIPHGFRDAYSAPQQDGPAPWENNGRRSFEEEMRNEVLWMFDYMRKNRIQGITQALSGGADSTYNAAKVRLMVELGCAELGVEGFLGAMSHLTYRDQALAAFRAQGHDAAVETIMENMLTCVYMGTDNSSDETLRAARTLVEGGTTAEGVAFKGIGGKFHYRNVQRLVEVYAEIYSGVNPGKISDERDAEIRHALADILRTRPEDAAPDELNRRIENLKSTFEEVTSDVLSVANPAHQIAYENIQARLRQVLIMVFSNVENKLAISNPNLDEGRNSYATWGGDLHGGMISGNAHKDKARQLEHMRLLYEHGLEGIDPLRALYWANKNRPSAELQPRSKDGKVTQFDEDQLGRSFHQMRVISKFMLYDRPLSQNERKNSPTEVFLKCRDHDAFTNDDIETLHDRIRLSYEKWGHAQFKIHGSPISMTYGENIDHQSSLRTPNISANHKPEQAQMALFCLSEMAARDGIGFEQLTGGHSLEELSRRALVDDVFGSRLSSKMWTPGATDGRKMKIGTLYAHIREKGFAGFLAPTPMADIIAAAQSWKKQGQPLKFGS